MSRKHKIFLAADFADREFARDISELLEEAGLETNLPLTVEEEKPLFSKILKDLAASDLLVFIVPSHEGAGKWALAELGAARAMNKQIVGIVPSHSRYSNADAARRLSGTALVDASRLSDDALVDSIVSSVPAA